MKKFDLYEELKYLGFEEGKNQFGNDCMTKTYKKTVEVLWQGEYETSLKIEAQFNPEHSVVNVLYYEGRPYPFKVKVHLNEKRALNAIRDTAKNHGFEI